MTDPVERKNLLPGNVFPREQAIHDADAAIEDLSPERIIKARDPARSPVDGCLQALGWERSVDVWDQLWPEDIKRAAVIAAPEIHRYKGTKRAVKAALGVLQVDAEIIEWWQTTPKGAPYTFEVKAYARARLYDGPLLDPRLIEVAYSSVLRAKPVSRAFSFTVGAGLPVTLGLAPVLIAKVRLGAAVKPRANVPRQAAALALAPVLVAKARLPVALRPQAAERTAAAALGLAPVLNARVRLACALVPILPPS